MPKKQSKSRSELVFLPLGGVGEIGMNLYLYGVGPPHKRRWLMVDLGVTFGGPREPGIDLILPDIRFIEEERDNLAGIVLTHAHEDHFGAVMTLWPRLRAPLYATPFTAALLRAKLIEEGREGDIPIEEVACRSTLEIGPFTVELVDMAHSIPETNGLLIQTEAGTAFHTSDWKLDGTPVVGAATDRSRIRKIGADGLNALICDSTNATRDGVSASEADVAKTLSEIVAAAPHRVAITTFASNVARLRSAMDAASSADRHVVIVGRAMKRVIQVAEETGYLPSGYDILTEDDYGHLPREKVLALCTGSQGEGRAALARIAADAHPRVTFARGDMVLFSSRTIPGNEKAVGQVQNNLVNREIEVVTDADALIHVSGHPRRGELSQLYEWTKPKVLVPMHGEARHLEAQAGLAREQGAGSIVSARNGSLVRLCPGPAEVIDDAPAGRLYLDGKILVHAGEGPVEERRRLSFGGAVAVSVVLNAKGDLVAEPQVSVTGIPMANSDGILFEELMLNAALGVLDGLPRPRRRDSALVAEAVRRAVRGEVNAHWGKKPPCSVMVTVV
ncbi:MAG: ribonuclease J [Hyphomicrobiaceae bacterium]|nr:ribonuclease J [Hyphomicrobiaceae bacterium]